MKLFAKVLLLLALCNNLMAQEKARLQERKKLLLEEIQFSNKVLEQTKKEKDVSFHQIKTLKQNYFSFILTKLIIDTIPIIKSGIQIDTTIGTCSFFPSSSKKKLK